MTQRRWLWRLGGVMLAGIGGCCCCPLGDPSCALHDEMHSQPHLRQALYFPELSLEGLNKTDWYCCPVCWDPKCGHTRFCGTERPAVGRTVDRVFAAPKP
jgi:hypothetical protein